MNRTLLSVILIFSLYSVTHTQLVNMEWSKRYSADGSYGKFIMTDLAGNVYMAGIFSGMDSPMFTFVQKFSPAGIQLFSTVVDTPCMLVSAYMDGINNLYIAGYNLAWTPPKSSIVKYNSSGVKLWRVSESISFNDAIIDMAGDIDGNSTILRKKSGLNEVIVYNSEGNQLLLFNITDTIAPRIVYLDNQNNILVNGDATLSGNIYAIITIKYSSTGVKQWKSVYIPPGGYSSSLVPKMRTGNSGNIYLTFTASLNANSRDYIVLKYDPAGLQQWMTNYDGDQFDDVSDIAIDSLENIYISGSSGIIKLNTSGVILWADTTSGMVSLVLDKYNNIYATGSGSSMMKTIKISNSGNKIWSINYSSGSPYSDWSNAISLDSSANVFITGLAGYTPMWGYRGGAATIKYSQLAGINQPNSEIPAQFTLSQNYPNPFNPATKIKFSIPKTRLSFGAGLEVVLIIYDALGREVQTLVNENLSPGTYEVDFDGSDLVSGVYFYTLSSNDFVESRKMVLIK